MRWLAAGLAASALAVFIAWVLFIPAADWLARHDVGSATGSQLESARQNARGGLLTLGAGLLAAGALIFTARNFTLSRRTLQLSARTFALTEQGQVTERYSRSVEQLGSEKIDIRIGGIYALERVALDSARDHPTIMEVLSAFVREHSRENWGQPVSDRQSRERSARPDVQAALTVIGRLNPGHDTGLVDLRRANLTGADLTEANLAFAKLTGADFTDAGLDFADLTGADLTGANLTGANLTGARLAGADLTSAKLTDSNLTSTDFTDADLTDADLTRADLTRASFADARLTDALWLNHREIPEGWVRDSKSGRLTRGR